MKNQSGSGCTQSIVWNAVPANKNFKFSLFLELIIYSIRKNLIAACIFA